MRRERDPRHGTRSSHALILGGGADTRLTFGARLEIITAVANIATAVVLFPILKRQSEAIALGYVATRILESTVIVVGLISLMSIITLREDLAGAAGTDSASLEIAGRSLAALKDWTFLLGPAFCAGLGNGILLGYLMYKSGQRPEQPARLVSVPAVAGARSIDFRVPL